MPDYEIPNRASSYKTVCAGPINQNTEYIEDALNDLNNKTSKIDEKIDKTEKGAAGGVATLDGNAKVPETQLPEDIYTQVFEVYGLEEQLALDANIGDTCRRIDLGQTYILKAEPASTFENWMAISVIGQEIPIQTGGTEPSSMWFSATDWEAMEDGRYRLVYTASQHYMGEESDLFVVVKQRETDSDVLRKVFTDYTTDSFGTVTIFSETPFDGIATITNLQGNSDPINCIPYSIHRAKYDSTGAEALFVNNTTSLSLNIGDDTIVLVDGYSKRQLIESCDATSVAGLNGTYEIFVDSENINDISLSELTFLPADDYLGVTRTIPTGGSDGQRCYVAFDHSYEYSENSWHLKAFTHIGRVVITDGEVDKIYPDPYNQNGVSTNYLSTNKDYLFGKEFDRLNVSATTRGGTFLTHIRINPGQCLSDDFQRILTLEQELVRDVITPWEDDRSSGAGSLIGSLALSSWLNIFLIGDDYGNADICSSTSSNPVIPSKYTHKRHIATLRLSDDFTELMNFSNPNQSNRFYIEPLIVLDTTFGPNNAAIIPNYRNTLNASELFLTYSFNSDPGVITVQIEAIGYITIGYYTGTIGTFSTPADYRAIIKTANTVTGTISLVGYSDSHSLYPYSP